MFSFDISTIIISYLKLCQLSNFFSGDIDYKSRFSYSGWLDDDYVNILNLFPNIVLKNMYLERDKIVDDNGSILSNHDDIIMMLYSKYSVNSSMSGVNFLSIKNVSTQLIEQIHLFKNLESVTFYECDDTMKLNGLEKCVNLHTIKMLFRNEDMKNSYIIGDDVRVLSMCPRLKRLELSGILNVSFGFGNIGEQILSCCGLRHFKYVCCDTLDSLCSLARGISCIHGCSNLRTFRLEECHLEKLDELPNYNLIGVSLRECRWLKSVNALGKCRGLRWVNLSGCVSLENISVLGKCRRLRWVNLSGCVGLKDISVLKKCRGYEMGGWEDLKI